MERIKRDEVLHRMQQESIAEQELILENEVLDVPAARFDEEAEVLVTKNRSFEAARPYAEQGLRTAVLNFASSTNPGGGVTHGASAQEECLCRCSTLYNCLNTRAMWDGFYTPHRRSGNPLHNDDIIYTPNVTVLKDDDYELLDAPFAADVITCAAPNLREQTTNRYNPADGEAIRISKDELYRLHKQRARRILTVAALHQADVVILGAFGCGAFKNDPHVVASAYFDVLPEFRRHFRTIEFAVYCPRYDDSNYRVFSAKMADR